MVIRESRQRLSAGKELVEYAAAQANAQMG